MPFPDYPDPNQACLTFKGPPPDNAMTGVDICISDEQRGYNEAKLIWPYLNQEHATFCAAHANMNKDPRRYYVLGVCAEAYYVVDKPHPVFQP